ncbi:MAG: AAA family ATPase, partial [Spirochaetota bacterium]
MLIKRELESELLRLINYFPVAGIIGPRQVGKTTLARTIIPKLPKAVVYLDLDMPSDYNKLQNPEFYLSQNQDKCVV